MRDLPLPIRVYYNYLGYLYWFTHYTSTHGILGLRFSRMIKLLAIILVLAVWFYKWGDAALLISLLLLVWIYLAYWRAGRCGYIRFVADGPVNIDNQKQDKLTPYRRVACTASGVFSLHSWEKNVLFCPADYWHVPRGDHALMVEHRPNKYLYQFFNVALMQELQRGWLLYGPRLNSALSISYLSIWGPEFSQIQYSIFGSESKPVDPKLRTIYLSFPSAEAEEIICQNILNDVQRYRRKEQTIESSSRQADPGLV